MNIIIYKYHWFDLNKFYRYLSNKNQYIDNIYSNKYDYNIFENFIYLYYHITSINNFISYYGYFESKDGDLLHCLFTDTRLMDTVFIFHNKCETNHYVNRHTKFHIPEICDIEHFMYLFAATELF